MREDLERLESRWAEFNGALSTEKYLLNSGQKGQSNTAGIYAQYADLFTLENVKAVQTALAATTIHAGRLQRRLSRLCYALASEYLESRVAERNDQVLTALTAATVPVEGKTVPMVRVGDYVTAQEDPSARRATWQAFGEVLQEAITPLALALWQQRYAVARELGYTSYAEMFARLKQIRLANVSHDAKALLNGTAGPHRVAVQELLDDVAGVDLRRAVSADLGYALRAQLTRHTPALVNAMAAVRHTLHGLGIELDQLPGLVVDLEDRPGKRDRAAMYDVDGPRRVVVSCRPRGDLDDVRTLLHEMGHGLHWVLADTALPIAFQRIPDLAVTEAVAFLFESLAREAAWLVDVLGMEEQRAEELVAAQQIGRRCLVRQYCGAVLFQLAFDNGTGQDMAPRFRHIMRSATLVDYHPGQYLYRMDPELYAVDYVHGWMLEAQMRARLRRQFGRRWWQVPEAGHRLLGVLRQGHSRVAAELAREFGYPSVLPGALICDLWDDSVVAVDRKRE